jgi:hypothetical protein
MPETVESNPLFPLLTDALRAGPGSPEWHQAVSKLRAAGLADSDEYKMLVTVREHLASGRDYRSISAGPGFTRKVLEAVEQERKVGDKKPARRLPLATIIAVLSIVVVLGVVAYVCYQVFWKNPPTQNKGTAEELAGMYFPKVAATATFDNGLPAGWREAGSARLPLKMDKNGLRPGAPEGSTPSTSPADTIGKALVSTAPLPADQPFAVEVKLKLGRPTEDLIVQLFVSSETDFSDDKSTSSNELAWLVRGAKQEVRLDQVRSGAEAVYEAPRPDGGTTAAKAEPLTIRINVDHDFAAVFNDKQRLWLGANGLAAKPRTVGVRFLYVDPSKPLYDPPVVQSIRVLTK